MKRKGEHLPLHDAKKPRFDRGVENRLVRCINFYLSHKINKKLGFRILFAS
jgi:hypothetical protein